MKREPATKWIDSHCPSEHRFLVQLVGEKTIAEAAERIHWMFGSEAASQAVLVRGVYLPIKKNRHTSGPWHFEKDSGYMAFIPKSFKR